MNDPDPAPEALAPEALAAATAPAEPAPLHEARALATTAEPAPHHNAYALAATAPHHNAHAHAATGSLHDARALARARIIGWFRAALVVVGLSPWVLPVARARLPLGSFGVAFDLVFFAMCHRRPARTLFFEGVAMPLCSRCAGIFLGVALAAAIGRPLLTLRLWRWLFVTACALMLADVVTQDLHIHPVWHPTRILTGVLVGYGMVVGFLSGLARDHKSSAADTKPASAAP